MDDRSLMPFGKYQGVPMQEVPDSYLFWFWGENKEDFKNNGGFGLNNDQLEVMRYIEDSFNGSDLNE